MKKVAKIQNLIITTQIISEARIFTVLDENNNVISDMIESFNAAVLKAAEHLSIIEYLK